MESVISKFVVKTFDFLSNYCISYQNKFWCSAQTEKSFLKSCGFEIIPPSTKRINVWSFGCPWIRLYYCTIINNSTQDIQVCLKRTPPASKILFNIILQHGVIYGLWKISVKYWNNNICFNRCPSEYFPQRA